MPGYNKTKKEMHRVQDWEKTILKRLHINPETFIVAYECARRKSKGSKFMTILELAEGMLRSYDDDQLEKQIEKQMKENLNQTNPLPEEKVPSSPLPLSSQPLQTPEVLNQSQPVSETQS